MRLSQTFLKTALLDEELVTDAELLSSESYLKRRKGDTRTKSGADSRKKSIC